MESKVWKILILQIYMVFYGWENRTCTRKLLLNLIQTSKNNKSNISYRSTGHKKNLNHSELKVRIEVFFIDTFFWDTTNFITWNAGV